MNDIISDGDKNHRRLQKCLCEFCHYLHSEQVAFLAEPWLWQAPGQLGRATLLLHIPLTHGLEWENQQGFCLEARLADPNRAQILWSTSHMYCENK